MHHLWHLPSNHASWCSNVVHCWCVWHRSVLNIRSVLSLRGIVSADMSSQLSVNVSCEKRDRDRDRDRDEMR